MNLVKNSNFSINKNNIINNNRIKQNRLLNKIYNNIKGSNNI